MAGIAPALPVWPQAGRGTAEIATMKILATLSRALRVDDDALADHRDRIALILSNLSVLLLLPFVINHIVAGRYGLGLLIFVGQAMMGANGWALMRGRPAPVPFWLMTLGFMLGVCGSIQGLGMSGTFWAFPAIFVSFFLLPRWLALLMSVSLTLAAGLLAWQSLGSGWGAMTGRLSR